MRFVAFIVQLLFVALAVCVAHAWGLAEWFELPEGLPRVRLEAAGLATIIGVFVVTHAVLVAASWAVRSSAPVSVPRWWIVELMLGLSATALAMLVCFCFLLIQFDPIFHLTVYGIVLAGYVVGTLVVWPLMSRRVEGPDGSRRRSWGRQGWADAFHALSSRWMLAAIMLLPVPWALTYAAIDGRVGDPWTYFNKRWVPLTSWRLVDAVPYRFENPMDVAFPGTERDTMYVLCRPGRVYRVTPETKQLVVDISDKVGAIVGEVGALSIALHPRFGEAGAPQRGYAYILFARSQGGQSTSLVRLDLSLPDADARAASLLPLVEMNRPPTMLHTGGTVRFGADGMCYFSIGDLGQEWSQSVDRTFSGGVFRIDVDQRGGDVSAPIERQPKDGRTQHYFIPRDNPFFGRPDTLHEYYALGLRQPYRMSIDPVTGDIWVGDVGEDVAEEISRLRPGANAQWPGYEGTKEWRLDKLPDPMLGHETPPVHEYYQGGAGRSVIGGFVYRGRQHPRLYGQYIFGDWYISELRALDLSQDPPRLSKVATTGKRYENGLASIVPGPDGEIYVTTIGLPGERDGRVLKLVSEEEQPAVTENDPEARVVPPSPEESVRRKYAMICARCHGPDGKGLPEMTAGLAPRPDFTSEKWNRSVTDQQIRRAILEGGLAVGKSRDMPPWAGFIEENEVEPMIRLIRAFRAETADSESPPVP